MPANLGMAVVLKRLGVPTTYAKGTEIFCQDQQADLIYGLTAGAARTTRMLSDGRRQIGDFYYSGDVIGLETCAQHRFSAEALDICTVRAVRLSSLRALGVDGGFESAVWAVTRRELERTQAHLLVLGRKSACERVASFLLNIANQGLEQHEHGSGPSLAMSRQDMADYLGLTIETVSRMITHLQALKIVEFTSFRHFHVTRWDALLLLAA